MFFQKPWSEVSDEEISSLAVKLADETGGWVFHTPIDFSKPNPYLTIKQAQPKVMLQEDGD